MKDTMDWVPLVRAAQKGDRTALDYLTRESQGRVRTFIYRVTLDDDLAQDLCQETLLTMVKSVHQCQKANRYWPWLFQVARSKILQHYRQRSRQSSLCESATENAAALQASSEHKNVPSQRVEQNELTNKMFTAMGTLKQDHRLVLSLRCLEQLSYQEIAHAMQCSEVKVRVLFHRAKLALRSRLVKQGLDASVLGTGFVLFGKATAPDVASAATIKVPMQLLQTHWAVSTCSLLCSWASLFTFIGCLVLTSVAIVVPRLDDPPHRKQLKSAHFTMHSRSNDPSHGGSVSKGAYEQWYYYPEGPEGPVLARMQRWTVNGDKALCAWLASDKEHYYYDSGKSIAYLRNHTWWFSSGTVRRLPGDSPRLLAALDRFDQRPSGLKVKTHSRSQVPVSIQDNRFPAIGFFTNEYEYNAQDNSFFTFPWGESAIIKDIRDDIHKQGWTYYTFTGNIAGQTISGRGCIPFHYIAYQETQPWLKVDINGEPYLLDTPEGAVHLEYQQCYPREALLIGMPRPWKGLHGYDTLRRDSALCGYPFVSDCNYKTMTGTVTIFLKINQYELKVGYHLDMDNDVITAINIEYDDTPYGTLKFTYPQDIASTQTAWQVPSLPTGKKLSRVKGDGVHVYWLADWLKQTMKQ